MKNDMLRPTGDPLRWRGDLAERMVDGIHRWLDRRLETRLRVRVQSRVDGRHAGRLRRRLKRLIGAQDERLRGELQWQAPVRQPAALAEGDSYAVFEVRWPVFEGVHGEGVLLEPADRPQAHVIALPDCDWTPEQLVGLEPGVSLRAQFARRLAEAGCRVIVPVLINRQCEHSVVRHGRATNQPHREFLYRAAYELGRHIIGIEAQKVLALVDGLKRQSPRRPVGVFGYGEGGLLALHAAAIDTRIAAAGVSGYFGPRAELWREPLYRNVWSLLSEFGDAELAALVAPRPLIIETSEAPQVSGPPPETAERSGAAPGTIETPAAAAVRKEVELASKLAATASAQIQVSPSPDGAPGGDAALNAFLSALEVKTAAATGGCAPKLVRDLPDGAARQERQFHELLEWTQRLMHEAEHVRAHFWPPRDDVSPSLHQRERRRYRRRLWEEVIGAIDTPASPPRPRVRAVYDTDAFRGYEVVLDVFDEVFAYGILLAPKDLRPGERRPVVVCQHGLEGRPQNCAQPDTDHDAYHRFACQLAERGFVTFSPQNPYIGEDHFRSLQRKANPLGLSLFSFIVRQHEQIIQWLASLAYVDADRIGFYGISYGGKTAMRVPALLDGYCLSICSADFNEWVWKNVSASHRYTYLGTKEYEMPEFNLANTFNHAEMAWLICPRPFMVERGHDDGVAPDEWVAYEFAKARRRYVKLGIGERAEIEYFDGPHTIHGVGAFAFLHRWLNWPEPAESG